MKKLLLIAYFALSISILLTGASWLTWNNSCKDFYDVAQEGVAYSGMCAGDGIQFVGVFMINLIVSIGYLGVTALLFKVFGIKLTKK